MDALTYICFIAHKCLLCHDLQTDKPNKLDNQNLILRNILHDIMDGQTDRPVEN